MSAFLTNEMTVYGVESEVRRFHADTSESNDSDVFSIAAFMDGDHPWMGCYIGRPRCADGIHPSEDGNASADYSFDSKNFPPLASLASISNRYPSLVFYIAYENHDYRYGGEVYIHDGSVVDHDEIHEGYAQEFDVAAWLDMEAELHSEGDDDRAW